MAAVARSADRLTEFLKTFSEISSVSNTGEKTITKFREFPEDRSIARIQFTKWASPPPSCYWRSGTVNVSFRDKNRFEKFSGIDGLSGLKATSFKRMDRQELEIVFAQTPQRKEELDPHQCVDRAVQLVGEYYQLI